MRGASEGTGFLIPNSRVRNRLRNLVNSLNSREIAALPRSFYERAGSLAMTKRGFLDKLQMAVFSFIFLDPDLNKMNKRRTYGEAD